mmetsp:Transcript_29060/g.67377  ORF Transcript_29060/g.67377 Transcript_29060/m.67377 type:complete len:313 (-) Transcript_29060:41-979(-)
MSPTPSVGYRSPYRPPLCRPWVLPEAVRRTTTLQPAVAATRGAETTTTLASSRPPRARVSSRAAAARPRPFSSARAREARPFRSPLSQASGSLLITTQARAEARLSACRLPSSWQPQLRWTRPLARHDSHQSAGRPRSATTSRGRRRPRPTPRSHAATRSRSRPSPPSRAARFRRRRLRRRGRQGGRTSTLCGRGRPPGPRGPCASPSTGPRRLASCPSARPACGPPRRSRRSPSPTRPTAHAAHTAHTTRSCHCCRRRRRGRRWSGPMAFTHRTRSVVIRCWQRQPQRDLFRAHDTDLCQAQETYLELTTT